MIFSTTNSLEGKTINQYLGVVSGEVILGANIFKDLFAGIRDIVGGRSGAYEKSLQDAQSASFIEIKEKTEKLVANAVVEIDIDYETIGTNSSMLMVSVTGTAIEIS